MRAADACGNGESPGGMAFALPAALHDFVCHVLGDAALQAGLAAEIEADAFVSAAQRAASLAGIALDAAHLAVAIAPGGPRLGSAEPAPIALDRWPPAGWLPARSVATGGAPEIDWLWFGAAPLDRPFHDDDVGRARALPFNRLFRVRTGLAALVAGAQHEAVLPLAGMIHHMSRCGSTLVARLLMALPGTAVASEPEPFDAVLRWAQTSDAPLPDRLAALRAMAGALGRRRGPGQARFVIKLDSWHALALDLLRAAFPETPWVFLHRDPVAIMASHRAVPGMQAVPGLLPEALTGIAGACALPAEDYLARLLGRICEGAASRLADGGIAVDYADLAQGGLERILAHFGLAGSGDGNAALAAVWSRHAKHPDRPFNNDCTAIQALAPIEAQQLALRYVEPWRRRLSAGGENAA